MTKSSGIFDAFKEPEDLPSVPPGSFLVWITSGEHDLFGARFAQFPTLDEANEFLQFINRPERAHYEPTEFLCVTQIGAVQRIVPIKVVEGLQAREDTP